MALGLPVVASDIMGNPEIIEDKKTGFLVPKNDPESLAIRLKELLVNEDLRIEMGRSGREKIDREYNLKKNVVALEEIFKRYND
jgi:glycosyltransferase involved in cell wall biosynthesis